MSVRAMRRAFAVFLLTGLTLAAGAAVLYRYARSYPDRPLGPPGARIKVEIPRGASFPRVAAILERAGLIGSGAAFRVYANYKGVASKVRAGAYELGPDITPRKLLDILVHGVPAPQVTVLIPEGKNMLEVAGMLDQANVASRGALVEAMYDRRFLRRVGVPGRTVEGYLFPDTYRLRAFTPARQVLETLVRRHNRVYNALVARHRSGLKRLMKTLRWGHYEVVTMASIVEKETAKAVERPLIAGVFLNRLTLKFFQPRVLQTDPTIVYGCTVPEYKSAACGKFRGRIRRIQLDDRDNPYNTYTHAGLPPGPISNPGRAALEAVLAPTRSRYLFFVSRNDGTHKFSATRAEHEHAVDRFQRGKGTTAAGQDHH